MAADQRDWPRGAKKAVREPIADFFEEAAFLQGLTAATSVAPAGTAQDQAPQSQEPIAQDWDWTRGRMLTLLDLTLEFGRLYSEAKRELGAVDFHDLEQFSLRLLWDPGQGTPTALAREWRKKLRLVFVDEYQDINAAQDAILRALGSEGPAANRFLVGDPEQSIYRFRLAAPHIFQDYTELWARASSQGSVAPLRDNFRSLEGILQVINSLFSVLMRKEIGGVPYDETAWLKCGNLTRKEMLARPSDPLFIRRTKVVVEFHLRLIGKGDSGPAEAEDWDEPKQAAANRSTAELEARMVGLRLSELREQKLPIRDASGERRAVDWRDMVVLLRSPQGKAEVYAKEFGRLGIPLIAARGGFFESSEIMDLLSLLSLLDNPLQDVPLLAVLRSPVVGMSFDQLALIRLCGSGAFWLALQQFRRLLEDGVEKAARGGPGGDARFSAALNDASLGEAARSAWGKTDLFLQRFARWRRSARETSLSQCLDEILGETNYSAFLMPNARGEQQRGNLAKLLAWARRFDQFQRQGLYRFLRFIEAQQEAGIDHEPAPLDAPQAVRLMSIHQSKGLEFSVVAVADLGKAFNLSDTKAEIILDTRLGLCPCVKPPFTERRYPSLPHWLAQRRLRRETLGEEMRLLYVAMTRACDRLILAGSATRTAAERWSKQPLKPTVRTLLSAATSLDWVGPWMRQQTGQENWAEQRECQSGPLRWVVHSPDEAGSQEAPLPQSVAPLETATLGTASVDDSTASEAVAARLKWEYPFEKAVTQAAKMSVSTLRLGLAAELEEGEANRRRRRPAARASTPAALGASEAGAAHHTFLEYVSLDRLGDVASLQEEADRMEQGGILAAPERKALDLESIAAFWASAVGRDILERRRDLHRELPFTARFTLAELDALKASARAVFEEGKAEEGGQAETAPWLGSEYVIVTGVVDLAVLLPREIWLLDFKTDTVAPEDWKEIGQRYEPQIRLYALALSRIYDRPVTRSWLHALRLRRTLVCPARAPVLNPSFASEG